MKTAYVTDSGTGFNQAHYQEKGIISFPLQITIDDQSYLDMETIQMEDVIQKFQEKKVFYTSQPVYGTIMDTFEHLKEEGYEKIVAVPICRGLSGTANTLENLALQNDMSIQIVDTHVTARVQDYLIRRMKELLESGSAMEEVLKICDQVIQSTRTLIIPKTLDQLSISGRLTHLAAAVAHILKIIPILEIGEKTKGKIDVLKKIRTFHKALQTAIETIAESQPDESTEIYVAHVGNVDEAQEIASQIRTLYPLASTYVIPLPNCVACHVGQGSISLQWFKKR